METYLAGLEPAKVAAIALGVTQRYLPYNRRKGFELANFEKLSANSNAFVTKRLRIY